MKQHQSIHTGAFVRTSWSIEVPSGTDRAEYRLNTADIAPCHLACPVGINVKGYVTAIAGDNFEKALEIIRDDNCLPSVCGRVCTHPCERECTRKDYGGSINIRALKRFVSDYERRLGRPAPVVPAKNKRKEKVVVIGSGPAGLASANDLAKLGYNVIVYEKENIPGGLMTSGIPEFRLSRKAVLYDIRRIESLGVEIKLNSPVTTPQQFNRLRKEYDAVLLATGAHRAPSAYRIAQSKPEGVLDYIRFAKNPAGFSSSGNSSIAVIGLGQSALDTARIARRSGWRKVVLIYPRLREEIQVFPGDIEHAVNEGVEVLFGTRVESAIVSVGAVTGVKCVRMQFSPPDETGRRTSKIEKGSGFELSAGAIIPVEPHYPETEYLPGSGICEISRWGYVKVEPSTLSTGAEGVFAAGDMVTGPKSIIESMAAGRRASASIHAYLQGGEIKPFSQSRNYPMVIEPSPPEIEPAIKPLAKSWSQGDDPDVETEKVYSDEKAVEEARRCLRCGPCMECVRCSSECPREVAVLNGDIEGTRGVRIRLPKRVTDEIILQGHPALELKKVITVPPEISSASSVTVQGEAAFCVVDQSLCIGCGNCEEICEYRAPRVEFREGRFVSNIHRDICRECGTCAAHCPSGAIRQLYFSDEYICDEINRILKD